MKRRQFLGTAAVGIGVLATGQLPGFAKESPGLKSGGPVDLVPLTKEVKCSRIGFGTGMRGGNRQSNITRADHDQSVELLRFAYENGVRFFDCADLYGSHQIVAESLEGKPRDSYALGSKIWIRPGGIPEKDRPDAEIVVARFLKELKTEYIDLVQLHCMDKAEWSKEPDFVPYLESLEKCKQKGMIRAHGVSTHSNAATDHAASLAWTDVIHVRINSEGMNMDGPKDDAVKRVTETVQSTKLAHDAGKGIIAMKVLGEGKMAQDPGMRKKSTNFVTNLDCVDVMIVGFEAKDHITEFIANVAEALKRNTVQVT